MLWLGIRTYYVFGYPLSFNDIFAFLCWLKLEFWYENINISNIIRRRGWSELGREKVGWAQNFLFLSHFSPTGPCSTSWPHFTYSSRFYWHFKYRPLNNLLFIYIIWMWCSLTILKKNNFSVFWLFKK